MTAIRHHLPDLQGHCRASAMLRVGAVRDHLGGRSPDELRGVVGEHASRDKAIDQRLQGRTEVV
jgi:hypothetical protein